MNRAKSADALIGGAVTSLTACLFCDSGICGVKFELTQALKADVAAGAAIPDPATISLLVCGDEEGRVPLAIAETYVNLNVFLTELCQ